MKKYFVEDLQGCDFMGDTRREPMTANELRARFWSLDDCRSEYYKDFTMAYIEDMWLVRFVNKEEGEE